MENKVYLAEEEWATSVHVLLTTLDKGLGKGSIYEISSFSAVDPC